MFLAIIIDTYSEVRTSIREQSREMQVCDVICGWIRKLFRCKRANAQRQDAQPTSAAYEDIQNLLRRWVAGPGVANHLCAQLIATMRSFISIPFQLLLQYFNCKEAKKTILHSINGKRPKRALFGDQALFEIPK